MSATISLLRETTLVTDVQVRAAARALQTQISRDFAPFWLHDATVVVGKKAGAWPIHLMDHSDVANSLGYHWTANGAADGSPIAFVGIGDDIHFHLDWHVTLSHEALEMLANPTCGAVFPYPGGMSCAAEVGDPVESDRLAYPIYGLKQSNFVTPAYFTGRGTRYDFRRVLTAPLTLAPGGYISILENGTWRQEFAQAVDGDVSRMTMSHRAARIGH